ncbi:hypothetical protein [Paraburkholderia aspalathi]|uniref:hypothetical protein n=1 Tax=Paraburkholderia aspalathi TaxID=1324617 RepID=UPI0038B72E36
MKKHIIFAAMTRPGARCIKLDRRHVSSRALFAPDQPGQLLAGQIRPWALRA